MRGVNMSEMNFAKKLSRLEEITKKLEAGECSLEEAIALYDEGKKLALECSELLDKAKQKIEVVE